MANTLTLDTAVADQATSSEEFRTLKKRIKAAGLLEKQPLYYTYKIFLTLAAFLGGLLFLFLAHSIWLYLLDAVYLAIVMAQLAYLGHDVGHSQVFAKAWQRDLMGLVLGNLFLGMSRSWWVDKHNEHHSHPNEVDLDPDLNIPGICFDLKEARKKQKGERFITRHQVFFFFPMLMLVAIDMTRTSLQFIYQEWKQIRYPIAELLLLLAHILLPTIVFIAVLGWWQALLFLLVNQAVLGFILGSAFAPNHKGMPVLEKGSKLNFFRRQVLTSRNIRGHFLTDFWYGGLNYQIEHHLFPGMPRKNLQAAQIIVKDFCRERDIPYVETSVTGSYQAILTSLYEVSDALRYEEKCA